ncbi:MAG: tail fiber domain-containing protein [Saprospiraceae bacterium]|nr:tail fiber domain-containing protein [Saprospiraceae bacterium]
MFRLLVVVQLFLLPFFISAQIESVVNPQEITIGQKAMSPPNDTSSLTLSGLFLKRNFGTSSGTWSLEKITSPPWLTGGTTALRIARKELNTPNQDDRTALVIDPSTLKIGINTGTDQPPFRLSITDNATSYPNNNLGSVTVYNSGNVPGSSIVGIFNNAGNQSGTITYAVGKVGGYWSGGGRNAGVHGHITGIGSSGYGVLGTVADPANSNADIDHPTAWGALAYGIGSQFYSVYSNGQQFSTTGTLWTTSDQRLKENIRQMDHDLEMICALNPVSYNFKNDPGLQVLSFPTEMQYGFLAQEVEAVVPYLVRDVDLNVGENSQNSKESNQQASPHTEKYKAVQILGFIPILAGAVKELDVKYQEKIQHLEAENEELKARMAALEQRIQSIGG